jgi:hypothetical protein
MNNFILKLFSLWLLITGQHLNAQTSRKVLFLGNSYTSVNNLPQLIHDVALSVGDTLVFDSNAPGGYQLIDHSLDVNSQNKIMSGGWEYVVIQGQSQESITQTNDFYNGGSALYTLIKQYNPCAVTVPYMTWGYKNGDASNCATYPVMCTYQGMDTTIRERYLNLTSYIDGEVSPVSVVWNYIRQNFPNIELYQLDESHPSAAGSYAAACCFYTTLFKKDPTLITFNFGLNATDASIIKDAVKTKVYDSLQLWDFKKLPIAEIYFEIGSGANEMIFHAPDMGVEQNTLWDFGDGDTSSSSYSPHSYLSDGTYTVSLTTTNCDLQGLHTSFADTVIQFCSHTPTIYTSNPWLCRYDTLWTEPADSYQWFVYGVALPETNQYLANYFQYNISGFSVLATVNGCLELSQNFTDTPLWSGYYFDIIGDPCFGDTVPFAVLHTNGFLSGLENILWYKNDSLLPLMTNEDTLFITGSGKFECKVIDSNSDCPLDTTSYFIEFNCGGVGVEEMSQELFCNVFPNPVKDFLRVKSFYIINSITIYDVLGKSMQASFPLRLENEIDFSFYSSGVYFVMVNTEKGVSGYKVIK